MDLGLVHDIRVLGDTVQVIMYMPHLGRPWLGYFVHRSGGNSKSVESQLLKVAGVKPIVVEQVWEPGWSSNRLTDEVRGKLGLEGRSRGGRGGGRLSDKTQFRVFGTTMRNVPPARA